VAHDLAWVLFAFAHRVRPVVCALVIAALEPSLVDLAHETGFAAERLVDRLYRHAGLGGDRRDGRRCVPAGVVLPLRSIEHRRTRGTGLLAAPARIVAAGGLDAAHISLHSTVSDSRKGAS